VSFESTLLTRTGTELSREREYFSWSCESIGKKHHAGKAKQFGKNAAGNCTARGALGLRATIFGDATSSRHSWPSRKFQAHALS
jgi:hypothetical protein